MTVGELRAVLDWADDSLPVEVRTADGQWLAVVAAKVDRGGLVVIDTMEADHG